MGHQQQSSEVAGDAKEAARRLAAETDTLGAHEGEHRAGPIALSQHTLTRLLAPHKWCRAETTDARQTRGLHTRFPAARKKEALHGILEEDAESAMGKHCLAIPINIPREMENLQLCLWKKSQLQC